MALVQVAADWDALTDAEKRALFDSNGVDTPSLSDLETLGTFTVAMFSFINTPAKVQISAAPMEQIVIQKTLISLSNFADIAQVVITPSLSGTATQTYAFTSDGVKYYVYNAGQWDEIATEAITVSGVTYYRPTAAAMATAMDATDVAAVPGADWDNFKSLNNALGVAYYMAQSAASDSCRVDELAATITVNGTFEGAVHGTDYGFSYVTNTALTVSLYSSGDFKINYAGVAE